MPPKKSQVVESKYVARPAPYLEAVDGESILDFIKEYEKYSKIIPANEKAIPMYECIDPDVYASLKARYAGFATKDTQA